MTSKELLKLLEKHEQVCNARFDGINAKLNKLDNIESNIQSQIDGKQKIPFR